MPTILRRVNHAVMYHFCMKIWPFTFLFLPLLNAIARQGTISQTGKLDSFTTSILWCGIAFILCIARVAFLSYAWVTFCWFFGGAFWHKSFQSKHATHQTICSQFLIFGIDYGSGAIFYLLFPCNQPSICKVCVTPHHPKMPAFTYQFLNPNFSALFALSASGNLLGGYLWVAIMVSIGFTSSLFSRSIVKESIGL